MCKTAKPLIVICSAHRHSKMLFCMFTVSFQKYTPSFCTLQTKVERGHLLEYSVRLVHTPLPSVLVVLNSTITTTAAAFWRNSSFTERLLREISGACVDTKLRGTEATCIVCGNGGQLHVSSRIPSRSNKNLSGGQKMRRQKFYVNVLRTQSTMELNQKLTKHFQKTLNTGHLHRGKIPM